MYLPVPLQMLPDSHGFLDQVVEVLGQVRGQALRLEDSQDLVACDETHLGHTMGIPQNHTWTWGEIATFRLPTVNSPMGRRSETTKQQPLCITPQLLLCDFHFFGDYMPNIIHTHAHKTQSCYSTLSLNIDQ